MKSQINRNVLISGASFAGLTTAYWMNKMGYKVTIVEIGNQLKKGGTPVDIKDRTIDIVKRMGLYEQIKEHGVRPEKWEFKDANDVSVNTMVLDLPEEEFEIERDTLLGMMNDLVKNEVEFIFNNSITALVEIESKVAVTFKDGLEQQFDFVFGCDGIHSAVRKIWFGSEDQYASYLGQYFSIAVVNKLMVDNGAYQMYAEPNKGLALYAHKNKTDVIFTFRSESEISYDFRNPEQMKQIVLEQMKGMKWRVAEIQNELMNGPNFYFDKFCQIKMPSWTKGRVALIGDAGYCASPAAGMGGSLAIIGATALADAFDKNSGNHELAFADYNKNLRPFIEEVQDAAVIMLDKLLPRTQAEIDRRNEVGFEF